MHRVLELVFATVLGVAGYAALREATLMVPLAIPFAMFPPNTVESATVRVHLVTVVWNATLVSSVAWLLTPRLCSRISRLFPVTLAFALLIFYGYLMLAPAEQNQLYYWRPVWLIVAILAPFIGWKIATQTITTKRSGYSSADATEPPRL